MAGLLFTAAWPIALDYNFDRPSYSFDRPSTSDANATTGPEVGEKIPTFMGIDQYGRTRSFSDIKGPKGALILFHRSADW